MLKAQHSIILMYVGPVVTEDVACAAFAKLEYYASVITNQTVAPVGANLNTYLCHAETTRSVIRVGVDYNKWQLHTNLGNRCMNYTIELGKTQRATKICTFFKTYNIFCLENNISYLKGGAVELGNATCNVISHNCQVGETAVANAVTVLTTRVGQRFHL
jgi:hypothetical protein